MASGKTWNRRFAIAGGAALLQKAEAIAIGYVQNARDFNRSRWLWIK